MRVLVCGGREFLDRERLYSILDAHEITDLAHGAARGADSLADEWALDRGIRVWRYPANWAEHGKAAGPRRNIAMLEDFDPELVIAFPGGVGTKHMINISKRAEVRVVLVGGNLGEIYVIPEWPI